jgi:hypothetical protein
MRGTAAAAGSRHDRLHEPEPRAPRAGALEPDDGAQLAEQADLADGDVPRGIGPVALSDEARAKRERQVEAGLGDRRPAGEVRVDVVASPARCPARRPRTATEEAEAVRIEPLALRAGVP